MLESNAIELYIPTLIDDASKVCTDQAEPIFFAYCNVREILPQYEMFGLLLESSTSELCAGLPNTCPTCSIDMAENEMD